MNRLLKEILRWQKPLRSGNSAARWIAWADSLARRHNQVAGRSAGFGFTFARISRWLYLNLRYSLNGYGRALSRINSSTSPASKQPAGSLPPAGSLRKQAFEIPGQGSGLIRQFRSSRGGAIQIPNKQISDASSTGSIRGTPRKRVVAQADRRHIADENVYLHPNLEIVVAKRTQKIWPRLINERQRIEMAMQSGQRGVIKHKQPDIGSIVKAASDATSPQMNPGRNGSSGSLPRISNAAPDIERLTEQVVRRIDQRIVAHRERMGQAF